MRWLFLFVGACGKGGTWEGGGRDLIRRWYEVDTKQGSVLIYFISLEPRGLLLFIRRCSQRHRCRNYSAPYLLHFYFLRLHIALIGRPQSRDHGITSATSYSRYNLHIIPQVGSVYDMSVANVLVQ